MLNSILGITGIPFCTDQATVCNSSLMVPIGSWWREAENIKECCIAQAQSPNLFDRFKSCRVFSVTILISISDFYREYFALFSKMMWCTDDLVTFFFSLSSPGVRQKQTSHDIPDMRNRRTMVVIYFWSIYTHKDLGTCFLTSLRVTI